MKEKYEMDRKICRRKGIMRSSCRKRRIKWRSRGEEMEQEEEKWMGWRRRSIGEEERKGHEKEKEGMEEGEERRKQMAALGGGFSA